MYGEDLSLLSLWFRILIGDVSSSIVEGWSILKSFWSVFDNASVWVFKFKFDWEENVAVEVEWVWVEDSAVETFILFDDDDDLSLDFQILDRELTMETGDRNLKDSNSSDATSLAKTSISFDKLKMLN